MSNCLSEVATVTKGGGGLPIGQLGFFLLKHVTQLCLVSAVRYLPPECFVVGKEPPKISIRWTSGLSVSYFSSASMEER